MITCNICNKELYWPCDDYHAIFKHTEEFDIMLDVYTWWDKEPKLEIDKIYSQLRRLLKKEINELKKNIIKEVIQKISSYKQKVIKILREIMR